MHTLEEPAVDSIPERPLARHMAPGAAPARPPAVPAPVAPAARSDATAGERPVASPTFPGSGASGEEAALCWSANWINETYRRCKSQDHCANEFGVAWRYQVPDRRRSEKAEGRCLCQRYCKAPIRRPGPSGG